MASGAAAAWEVGQIAFLHDMGSFPAEDRVAMRRTLPRQATRHPAIILDLAPGCALVTTVSAYSSPEVNVRPPWRQAQHRTKARDDFRAFEGCVRPTALRPFLRLRPGQAFPKPKTSWVYAGNAYLVPLRALGTFTKVKGNRRLEMETESLEELRRHIAAVSSCWEDCQCQLAAARGLPVPAAAVPAVAASAAAPVARPAAARPVAAPAPVATPVPARSWAAVAASKK